MNKPLLVTLEGSLDRATLDILRGLPRVAVVAAGAPQRHRAADAVLSYDDHHERISIEVKRTANTAIAWEAVRLAALRPGLLTMLVAQSTTTDARKILTEHGVAFADGLGNADIQMPGLFYHVEARASRHEPKSGKLSLRGKAGVAVLALLLDIDRPWNVNELALEANISRGLAHRIFTRLESDNLIAAEGAGPSKVRHVTHPTALFDLWAEEQQTPPRRVRAYHLARTPRDLINDISARLERSAIEYAITGAAAASLLAPYITTLTVLEVWIPSIIVPEVLSGPLELDMVEDGANVVFLQSKEDVGLAFRENVSGVWLANRLRLYADLRRDPRRGREQADHLRQEVIRF